MSPAGRAALWPSTPPPPFVAASASRGSGRLRAFVGVSPLAASPVGRRSARRGVAPPPAPPATRLPDFAVTQTVGGSSAPRPRARICTPTVVARPRFSPHPPLPLRRLVVRSRVARVRRGP
eukprot:4043258-Pleurochrysis_carterae.AAC.1